eukprot:6183245-Pleurochrysis_carterae.AAC.2
MAPALPPSGDAVAGCCTKGASWAKTLKRPVQWLLVDELAEQRGKHLSALAPQCLQPARWACQHRPFPSLP